MAGGDTSQTVLDFLLLLSTHSLGFWGSVLPLHTGQRWCLCLSRVIFALGISMTFINIPVEWFSIGFDWTWMLLFGDIRQGIFYAMLLSFWIIFCGEHMMVGTTPMGRWFPAQFQEKLAAPLQMVGNDAVQLRGFQANLLFLFLLLPTPCSGPERAESTLGVLEAGWTHRRGLLLPLHLRHVREVGAAALPRERVLVSSCSRDQQFHPMAGISQSQERLLQVL